MTRKLIPIVTIILTTSIVIIGCSGGSGDADTNVPIESQKSGGMKPTGGNSPSGANEPALGKPQPN